VTVSLPDTLLNVLSVVEIICGHPLDNFTDEYMRFTCSTPSSGYVYGASCRLSCSAYLPLEGTDLITCETNDQSEGVWSWGSGDKPYCRGRFDRQRVTKPHSKWSCFNVFHNRRVMFHGSQRLLVVA
jgi:hypothetical protein